MIDKRIVWYISNLAKIKVSEEEIDFFIQQLSKILEYIDKLKELDLKDIEPLRHLYFKNNVLREDKIENYNLRKEILDNSPSQEQDYFKIPIIF